MTKSKIEVSFLVGLGVLMAIAGCAHSSRKGIDERSDYVEYRPNQASSGIVPAERTYIAGGHPYWVQDNTGELKRTGYAFAGWNTEPDGTGKDYPPGSTIMMKNTEVILYAKWE